MKLLIILVSFFIIAYTFFIEKPEFIEKTNENSVLDQAEQAVKAINKSQQQISTTYKVTKVVDGDTIDVNINGKIERIRLIGINTPEIVDPRKPVECFGKEASKKAKEILSKARVSLETDSSQNNKDEYNRLLRYVFLEDGTNFNKLMIKQGYAYEYYYGYKYEKDFEEAQIYAKENKLGLWADDVCD